MRRDWERDGVAQAWSSAVADRGDIFQQLILKAWVAAAIRARTPDEREQVPKAFYEVLAATLSGSRGEPLQICLDQMSKHLDEVIRGVQPGAKLRVLDLGGGEGFLGRWLFPLLARYTLIDVSEKLLELGQKKITSPSEVQYDFLKGDLDDDLLTESTEEGFQRWLSSCSPFTDDDFPVSLTASDFDFVFCTNVIDHLQRPEALLRELAQWAGKTGTKLPVVLATLNPDFFLGPRSSTYPAEHVLPQTVSMGPAGQCVDVYPRSWLETERMISRAGFNICACETAPMSQYPPAVQKSFVEAARLEHTPAAGPFVLWLLNSARHGTAIGVAECHELAGKLPFLTRLRDHLAAEGGDLASALSRLDFSPGELIAYPSNPPHGIFMVEEGEARMEGRAGPRQVFGAGDLFGELETGDDIHVSRFLYPVRAGPNGCVVLRLENGSFEHLLDYQARQSLGDVFYPLLRDRVSTYSWVYHRSTFVERSAKENFTDKVNDRSCEALARILLFASTMEAGRLRREVPPSTEHDGLSTLILLLTMRGVIENTVISSKTTPFRTTIQLFHALGAIDAYAPMTAAKVPFADLFSASRDRIVRLAARTILFPTLKEACPLQTAQLSEIEEREFTRRGVRESHLWPDRRLNWSVFQDQITVNLKGEELTLSSSARDFASLFIECLMRDFPDSDSYRVRLAVYRFVYNLAFTAHEFYMRDQPRFFTVHDVYFLRRLAMGARGWEDELRARMSASSHIRGREVDESSSLDEAEAWRISAYLRRFECFAENYWAAGSDLRHSHDILLHEPGLIHRGLQREGLTVRA